MDDLLSAAQAIAAAAMTEAVRARNPSAPAAAADQIRFRADGKGGVFASPYPLQLELPSGELAEALPKHPWFSSVRPSGGWLALDPSELWLEAVRQSEILPAALCLPQLPPIPKSIGRIAPAHWAFLCRLGRPDPICAAALNQRNPGFLTEYALRRAHRTQRTQPRAELVCLCAQCIHLLAQTGSAAALARSLHRLAERYLAEPGESELTARVLDAGLDSLGIYRNFI